MTYTYHFNMDADCNRTEYISLEHICDWTSYCTHHNDVDPSQYVHADVHSYVPDAWMLYYTHHGDMDTPHYVHVDV